VYIGSTYICVVGELIAIYEDYIVVGAVAIYEDYIVVGAVSISEKKKNEMVSGN